MLLADPDPARETRGQKMPVVAMQQYGRGHVLYMGTDNFWRWRKNVGDNFHTRIWVQIVQRPAQAHLLEGARRTQLSSDQFDYMTGQPITIYAHLYTESFDPVTTPTVKGTLTDMADANKTRPADLTPVPRQRGVYTGTMLNVPAGKYRFAVDHDKLTFAEFTVTDPKLEKSEPAMNEPLLRDMVRESDAPSSARRTCSRCPTSSRPNPNSSARPNRPSWPSRRRGSS